ncbi:MAG: DUF885 family protein [Pseudomonadota bacterium]
MQLLQMFHNLNAFFAQNSRMLCLRFWILPAILAIAAAPLAVHAQSDDSSRSTRRAIAQSQAIAADFARTELALSPETASRLGLERVIGPTAAFALDNHSQAGFERRRLVRIELAQRLLGRPALPAGHPLTRDLAVAEQALQDLIALEQLGFGRFSYADLRPYAIDPYSGVWIEGPALLVYRQSINTADEAAAFLARLRSLSFAIDDTRRRLVADQASGLLLPSSLLDETQSRVDLLLADEAAALKRIVETFDALTRAVEDLEPERRRQLVMRVESEVSDRLLPAYAALSAAFDSVRDEASDHDGVWAQRRGQDIFAGILTASTGDTIPSERLHERHMSDLASISTMYFSSLSVSENKLDTAAPRPGTPQEIFAAYLALALPPVPAVEADEEMTPDPLFDLVPQSIWSLLAEAAEFEAQQAAFLTFETSAAIATPDDTANPAAPYRQLVEYPAIRTAWQHYAWAQSPPVLEIAEGRPGPALDEVAHQRVALIRAALAAIDTGIHLDRWTVDEATTFLIEQTAVPREVADQIVLRIVARPGYHTAIASTWHRINGLSERARAVLGEHYSEADFQSALISPGPRPLYLIEQDIEAWYGAQLAAPKPN